MVGLAGSTVEESAVRLSRARALLERSSLVGGPAPARSAPGADERILPLAAPLRALLPGGGLRRGSTVELGRSTALVFAVLAEASAAGSWCALVGLPEVGLVAAAEAGLELSRLALVPRPGPDLVSVAAALLDGVDLVVLAGGQGLPAGARQRLAARARHRGSVLLPVGPWPGADVRLGVEYGRWHGLVGGGAGRLRLREVRLRGDGRGAAGRGRSVTALLPGPEGAVVEIGGSGARGVLAGPAGVGGSGVLARPVGSAGAAGPTGNGGPGPWHADGERPAAPTREAG